MANGYRNGENGDRPRMSPNGLRDFGRSFYRDGNPNITPLLEERYGSGRDTVAHKIYWIRRLGATETEMKYILDGMRGIAVELVEAGVVGRPESDLLFIETLMISLGYLNPDDSVSMRKLSERNERVKSAEYI